MSVLVGLGCCSGMWTSLPQPSNRSASVIVARYRAYRWMIVDALYKGQSAKSSSK